jgi:hypothetical protein
VRDRMPAQHDAGPRESTRSRGPEHTALAPITPPHVPITLLHVPITLPHVPITLLHVPFTPPHVAVTGTFREVPAGDFASSTRSTPLS